MNSLSVSSKKLLKFVGWAISSFLFVIVTVLAIAGQSSSITVLIWALIFFPPFYGITKPCGVAWNIVGRLASFPLSIVLFALIVPSPTQIQNSRTDSPRAVAASPSPQDAAPSIKPSPSESPIFPIEPLKVPSKAVASKLDEVERVRPTKKSSPESSPSPIPSLPPSNVTASSELYESPEIAASRITKKYFDACSDGVMSVVMDRNTDIAFSDVRKKYGYDGFLGPFLFTEALCRVAKSRDGFSSESQARQAGASILIEVGAAYKRDEMFRELIKR
jgi:hypothetical protein